MYQETRRALWNAIAECGEDDWDGYGARKVDRKSYEHSLRFLDMLPDTIPAPEVAVDPDGMVAFEWHEEPRWVFSVSFETNGELVYADLFGNSKTHGNENFGQALTQSILDSIRRVYSRNSQHAIPGNSSI